MEDFFSYLKRPVYRINERPAFVYFVALFFMYVATVIPLSLVLALIDKSFHFTHNIELSSVDKTVLWAVALAPVYEEVFFRSWLKLKKVNVVLIIGTLVAFTTMAIHDSKIAGMIVFPSLLILFSTLLIVKGRARIGKFIKSNFKYFFYASVLLFGLVHATNFKGNPWLILALAPILGSPQIILGAILGFIRMKHGLFYSISFHMLVNAIFVLLALPKMH
jgi:hypothetical protein